MRHRSLLRSYSSVSQPKMDWLHTVYIGRYKFLLFFFVRILLVSNLSPAFFFQTVSKFYPYAFKHVQKHQAHPFSKASHASSLYDRSNALESSSRRCHVGHHVAGLKTFSESKIVTYSRQHGNSTFIDKLWSNRFYSPSRFFR